MMLAGTFVIAALRYWLTVFPSAARELRRWRRRAARIPNAAQRQLALRALSKRGNMEGAAAFAAVAPWRRRRTLVRALVAFQVAYNHADMLAEQPSADPVGDARRAHEALIVALDPDVDAPDQHVSLKCDDGGYMAENVDACRTALLGLPSYPLVAALARTAASRIVAFQSLSLGEREELEHWAQALLPADSGLEWWEAAAAAGSSLGVHALITAASVPSLRAEDLAAIEEAFFPWIGALHSLLDSLIDQAEDAASGQLSLVGCYPTPRDAAGRMRTLTVRALERAQALPGGRRQAVLVAAMACHYLSAPEASAPVAAAIADSVRAAIGGLAAAMLLIFRVRRLCGRPARRVASVAPIRQTPAAVCLSDGERRVDAGAA